MIHHYTTWFLQSNCVFIHCGRAGPADFLNPLKSLFLCGILYSIFLGVDKNSIAGICRHAPG